MKKTARNSKAPYRERKPLHPSLLETPLIEADYPEQAFDPYTNIDSALILHREKTDYSNRDKEYICIIGPDETCTGCGTCIRFGF
jgi:ferredoxin